MNKQPVTMLGITIGIFLSLMVMVCVYHGCAAPLEKVIQSERNAEASFVLVKRELVDPLPEGEVKDKWIDRLIAFRVECLVRIARLEGKTIDPKIEMDRIRKEWQK